MKPYEESTYTRYLAADNREAWAEANKHRSSAHFAWVCFYAACAVVGVLLATLAWQYYAWQPQCEGSHSMKLDPTEIRARGSEVYEL